MPPICGLKIEFTPVYGGCGRSGHSSDFSYTEEVVGSSPIAPTQLTPRDGGFWFILPVYWDVTICGVVGILALGATWCNPVQQCQFLVGLQIHQFVVQLHFAWMELDDHRHPK